MKNIIPIGWQCFNAQVLEYLNLRKYSLPFDYLRSPLHKIVEIVEFLREGKEVDLNKFLTANIGGWNVDGFFIGHFIKKNIQKIESSKDYVYTAENEIFDKFKRRFERFKNLFYENDNILLFNDIEMKDFHVQDYPKFLMKLQEINKKNNIIIITYKDRITYDTISNYVDLYKINTEKNKVSQDDFKKQIAEVLRKYLKI